MFLSRSAEHLAGADAVADRLDLPALGGQGLGEVPVAVEEADAEDGDAEVAGRLEVVAGEDAETPGVLRQSGGDAVLGGEISDGGRRVGYLNLRTFISTADPQLRSAFAQFRAQGVTELIVDFRYNGGGLVSIADLMGDLLGGNRSRAACPASAGRISRAATSARILRPEEKR